VKAQRGYAQGGSWAAFALALAIIADASAGAASGQSWSLEGGGPMQIPSLEQLSQPRAPRTYIPPDPAQASGPLGPFLNDTTLRRGDIVVTQDGPMTYQGSDAFTPRAEDFAPADDAAKPRRR
jgi:hypothetical protein